MFQRVLPRCHGDHYLSFSDCIHGIFSSGTAMYYSSPDVPFFNIATAGGHRRPIELRILGYRA